METLQTWIASNFDFPALVLVIILVLGGWILWKTQRDPGNKFDFTDMLRDEGGKPSAYRLAIFVCLAVSTWVIMYATIATKGAIDTWIFVWYIAIWSGAKVAEKGIEAYVGRNRPRRDQYYDDHPNRGDGDNYSEGDGPRPFDNRGPM